MKVRCQKGVINRSFQSPTILYNISYYIILYPLMRYNINDLWNIIAQKCGKSNDKLGILMGDRWEIYEKSMRNRSKSRENADPQPSFAATAPRSRSSTKLPAAKVAPRRPRLTSHWAKPGERLGNPDFNDGTKESKLYHDISRILENYGKLLSLFNIIYYLIIFNWS